MSKEKIDRRLFLSFFAGALAAGAGLTAHSGKANALPALPPADLPAPASPAVAHEADITQAKIEKAQYYYVVRRRRPRYYRRPRVVYVRPRPRVVYVRPRPVVVYRRRRFYRVY